MILLYDVIHNPFYHFPVQSWRIKIICFSPFSGSGVMVNNANVVMADIPTANGVIHIIDNVLVPKGI